MVALPLMKVRDKTCASLINRRLIPSCSLKIYSLKIETLRQKKYESFQPF